MKIVATSTETMDSHETREVTMEFLLTLEDKCYHNELTLNNNIVDKTYYVDREMLTDTTSILG